MEVTVNKSVSATLEAAATRCGCDDEVLSRFAGHLQTLPLDQAARINPFAFAEDAGIAPAMAIDLFVHGAKLGVFDLEWGTVCPLCGAITNSLADIGRVAEDVVHCALCNRDAAAVLDDTVEVTFAYASPGSVLDLHRSFVTYHHRFTSSSYPYRDQWRTYHERHTVAEIKIEPGQEATLPLHLETGQLYRLLCLDTHSSVDLDVAKDKTAAMAAGTAPLILSDSGFLATQVTLPAEQATLPIVNQTDQPVWCRVLRMDMNDVMAIVNLGPPQFGRRLTGKDLLNNQAFRDCFALDELAPDLKLKLRSLTLLFTDLKGSTALYDREGDLAAYRLVQDHFAALKHVVRGHSGAMIKTMGDAVMAAFPTGRDGATAAIAMMSAMQGLAGGRRGNAVGLKVGLHAGPALAITAGRSLDYFGQTVNIAARVQGLADAGDICLTRALNDDGDVPALLADAGYDGAAELARLKGVSAEEQIYRYRSTTAR